MIYSTYKRLKTKITERIDSILYKRNHYEIRRNTGYLPNVTFYVCRFIRTRVGIMNLTMQFLEKIKYAEDHGYIPLICLGDIFTTYESYRKRGKYVNVWEYWFEQPTHYGFSDVQVASHVIYEANSQRKLFYFSYEDHNAYFYDKRLLHEACDLYARYIHIRSNIIKKSISKYPIFYDGKTRVLGVAYRRYPNDPSTMKNEHIQPNIPILIRRTKQLISKNAIDKVFLSTSDNKAIELFEQEFGEVLIRSERIRGDENTIETIGFSKLYRDNYMMGEDYIIDTILLSRCVVMAGGINAGTTTAMLLNNLQYEERDFFDVGFGRDYPEDIVQNILNWYWSDEIADFEWDERYGADNVHFNPWK